MKTVAIIQARMGSSRLPGKVMKDLVGHTVLGHILLRLQRVTRLDQIIVATSDLARDNVIEQEARRYGVACYRGDEQDVLARYYKAATAYAADWVVRITADCPLIDPNVLDAMLEELERNIAEGQAVGFFSNTQPHTFPRGLDIEIFPYSALEQAYLNADKDYQREHVTPYIHENPQWFPACNFVAMGDDSVLRWTLDTQEDFSFISAVYEELFRDGEIITTDQVMDLLTRRPGLKLINQHVQQKAI